MSFPRYPAYKDSGVEWLGRVPKHWRVERLKHIATVFPSNVDKKSYDDEAPVRLCNYTDVYYNDEIREDMDLMMATATAEQIEKFSLRAGDTIITKDSETADDIAISAYVPNDLPSVVCGYHLSMVRPKSGAYGRFLKRFFDSQVAKAQAAVSANGLTRVGLGQYAIDNLHIAVPPVEEQLNIGDFLDRETAKIDTLVAEQEQLITLLKEKRQAVISHAVTKGLDPSVPMKDSGVEWLGAVPEHWAIAALNYRYEVLLGKMLDEKKISGNHLAPYLRNVDVQWDRINVDELPQMDFDGSDVERYGLRAGDLLVCEGGDVGRSAIWLGELTECYYQKALHRLRPRDGSSDLPRFQFYLMKAAAQLEVFSGGQGKATIAHLTAEALRRYRFAYPTRAEQEQIVKYLDDAVSQFDELINEATNATLLLQERRSALISAAVTGQIDVRDLT